MNLRDSNPSVIGGKARSSIVERHGQDAHATARHDDALLLFLSAPLRLCVTSLFPSCLPHVPTRPKVRGYSGQSFFASYPRWQSRHSVNKVSTAWRRRPSEGTLMAGRRRRKLTQGRNAPGTRQTNRVRTRASNEHSLPPCRKQVCRLRPQHIQEFHWTPHSSETTSSATVVPWASN